VLIDAPIASKITNTMYFSCRFSLANEGQVTRDIIIENENNCMLREENKVEVKFFKLKRNAEIIIRKYFHFAWNLYYLGS